MKKSSKTFIFFDKFILILVVTACFAVGCFGVYKIINATFDLWDSIKAGDYMTYGEDLVYCYINGSNSPRASVKGDFVAVVRLTEKGKEKDAIIIPAEIEGKPVIQIGMQGMGYRYRISTDSNYSKLWLPKSLQLDVGGNSFFSHRCKYFFIDLEDTSMIAKDDFHYYISSSLYEKMASQYESEKMMERLHIANVEYKSDGVTYFIDDYGEGEKITYIPNAPVKEGYTFGGWYKEPECLNPWDFEKDILTLYEGEKVLTLYAEWVKTDG